MRISYKNEFSILKSLHNRQDMCNSNGVFVKISAFCRIGVTIFTYTYLRELWVDILDNTKPTNTSSLHGRIVNGLVIAHFEGQNSIF